MLVKLIKVILGLNDQESQEQRRLDEINREIEQTKSHFIQAESPEERLFRLIGERENLRDRRK